jgi:hypothetical protein
MSRVHQVRRAGAAAGLVAAFAVVAAVAGGDDPVEGVAPAKRTERSTLSGA